MLARKYLKLSGLLFAAALLVSCLSSCAAGEFFATLGFDTHDYEGEKVITEYSADSEKALELAEAVRILTINSADVPEFDGTKDAAKKCRDSVLNYMYNSNYAKYAGNIELLDEASEVYPQIRLSVIIPADDFVNTFYKYFGGKEKVSNENGDMFEYVPGLDSYITAAQPQRNETEVNVVSLSETASTYRFTFSTSLDGEDGGSYFALIIKRADGSFYFKELKKI